MVVDFSIGFITFDDNFYELVNQCVQTEHPVEITTFSLPR